MRYRLGVVTLTIVVTLLSGCFGGEITAVHVKSAGKYLNIATVDNASYDNQKIVEVSQMRCAGLLDFSAYQDEKKSKRGMVLMGAGGRFIKNIGNKNSLKIKADGKEFVYSTTQRVTEFYNYISAGVSVKNSRKNYLIPVADIREIAAADTIMVRILFLDNKFIDDTCSPESYEQRVKRQKDFGFGMTITRKAHEELKKYSALAGFRKFVELIDQEFN